MFSFLWNNSKKSRSSRTLAMRKQQQGWRRVVNALRDRGVLLRLSVCLAGILLLLIVVQSWKPPFPFREGDVPAHGLASKIDFTRVDQFRTEQAQRLAEEQAAYVFRNQPELLDPLGQRLRSDFGKIADAKSWEELPEETRVAFGMGVSADMDRDRRTTSERYLSKDHEQRFLALKESVSDGDTRTSQQRIDDILEDFTQWIAPLKQVGIIDPVDVRERHIFDRSATRIQIFPADESGPPIEKLLSQVRLEERINEAGDLGKSWLEYMNLSDTIRPAISYWILQKSPYTLAYNDVATQEGRKLARESTPIVREKFNVGDLLVEPGKTIDAGRLDLLGDEYARMDEQTALPARLSRMGVVLLMILVLATLKAWYIIRNEPKLARSLGRLTVYILAIVGAAALGRLLTYESRAEVIPLIYVVMMVAIAYDQVFATVTAFSLALIITLSTTARLDQFVVLMSTAAVAVVPLSRIASRLTLVKVGLYAGGAYFFTSCSVSIISSQTLSEVFSNWAMLGEAIQGVGWCLAAVGIVAVTLPVVESTFDVVTDISLLELSNPSHPLLQELVQRAPGTYNHSIAVASIAETAADAIGANGLLVRVGAYFHDVGKMLKPQYFIENMHHGGTSRHEHLAPAMSTLIIIGHVKDGVDLAERHRLPHALIDFIEQHHGTTLVEYFFREATKQAEADPDHEHDCEESAFRYPGPKPQSREAGVLMLADAVESASRTLSDPTPKRIETLVHNLTMKRLLDGQFDECSLKLSEIRMVEQALVKSLIAIYHTRIRYPDAATGAKTA